MNRLPTPILVPEVRWPCFLRALTILVVLVRPIETSAVVTSLASPQVPGDSLGVAVDSLGLTADTVEVEPFEPSNLPARPNGSPAGWATGVWEWDREALRSTRALTVLELLEEITGVVPLRGGDYGQPTTATAFGVGAGRIRVYLDGAELPPLDGGVVDLSRTGLAGLDRVRVERSPGELRVEMFPLEFTDPRPYSFLEVGTGDLTTNVFRGVFAHPNALGGNVVVALDRIDTQGPRRQEPGTSSGAHVRHAFFPVEGLGVAWEFRRMSSHRPEELWGVSKLERTDWGVRARYDWTDWLQAGAFLQRSSIGVGERGEIAEPDEPRVNRDARSQLGAHMAVRGGSWWIEGEYRSQGGPGWPSGLQAIHGSGTLDAIGGATFSAERQSWDRGDAAVSYDARLWTRSLLGFSLFGEIVKGSRGVSFYVPPDPVEDPEGEQPAEPEEPEAPELPDVSLTERTGIRGGVRYEAGEFQVSAALLSIEADSLHPTGLPPDRDVTPTQGGSRSGFEFSANVPLRRLVGGLYLRGSAQFWGEGETWRYLPDRSYEARLSFHDVFYESENLELWVDAGVTGRDPMEVPWEGSQETVPFQQSWFGRLQVRVSSVRLFVRFDNFTVRDMNQDYPGRLTPRIRSMYGIRWTLWN